MPSVAAKAWLVPLSGPPMPPIEMIPVEGGATLGRGDGCAIAMPATADKVSRQHARFTYDEAAATTGGSGWRAADLGSSWGTSLNGVKLVPHREVPLAEGDLVRITPWTFSFSTRGVPKRGLLADNDTDINTTLVRSFGPAGGTMESTPPAMGQDLLSLLLESAAAIHAAEAENALADALVDAAIRGTGLANAAVLRPLDSEGRIAVVASQRGNADAPAGYSRSLLNVAAGGVVAELSADSRFDMSQSMVTLGISAAVCAPLMLGGAAAAFLYVDNAGSNTRFASPLPGAAGFCLALARMAGLALANLKRIEIEKRQAAMEHDLSAAARAQKWILPKRVTQACGLTCTGESRAGAYLGGDFFDVLPLDDHRVAIALGDVSGHGVAASVLMTAAQGFLNAALTQCMQDKAGLAAAVTALNRFVYPRRPANSFLTLWVGIFDTAARTVTYVNAGHGYAMLHGPGDTITMLDGGEDFPVGFDEHHTFGQVTAPLPPGARAVVISDGIVEQFDPGLNGVREQFGLEGVRAVLAKADAGDAISSLFAGVFSHAGSENLQDDATAVMIAWD